MKSLLTVIISVFFYAFNLHANVRFVRAVMSGNTSESVTIIWDQLSGSEPILLFDTIYPKDFNFSFTRPVTLSNHSKGMHNNIVRLKGLKSSTTYFFCIKDNEGFSRIYHVSTCSNSENETISLIAGGDSRDRRETRLKANKMVGKIKPHAVLFNGDFIGIDIEKQWIDWFEDWENSIGEDGRVTPLIVTRGNHELSNKVLVDLFDVPHKNIYYSSYFGGNLLHLVSLNSEILKIGGQKRFLRSALKENEDKYWQIAQYHRPVRPHVAHKKEMETQYRNFVPLFEKYPNLKLCLENDSHTCKTTWPILKDNGPGSEEGFKRNDSIGITYVGEGCWGAPLRAADDPKCWTRDSEAINQVNWILVSKDMIRVMTIKYENVDEVNEVNLNKRTELPEGIDLWTPSNGAFVDIYPSTLRKSRK